MVDNIGIAKSISIKETGKDEYWLQDQIYENPVYLSLGELEAIDRERKQSSGGHLDILLKDPEDETKEKIIELLNSNNISYTEKRKSFTLTIDRELIEQNREIFIKLAKIVKENKL